MKLSITAFLTFSMVALLLLTAVPLLAQEQEGDVRGAFLTSRSKEKPQNSTVAARPSRRRPKPMVTTGPRRDPGPTVVVAETGPAPSRPRGARMGLGLTLFMRDSNGLAVRTDPGHVFHKGDRVRVLLETNADGFLYIFNTTNDGPPVMIYPTPELDDAGNYMQAHVPFEIPSSLSTQERLRWFAFDENAGDEHLYFVFTREPLKGIPIEDDLMSYCARPNAVCPYRPSADSWVQIQTELKTPVLTDRSTHYGRAQTDSEKIATTRGIGLSQEDPEPSVVLMTSSTSGSILVTALDLIHR